MSPRSKQSNGEDVPSQRKTTLKWNDDGELTSVDMTRVIARLSNPELTKCDLQDGSEG